MKKSDVNTIVYIVFSHLLYLKLYIKITNLEMQNDFNHIFFIFFFFSKLYLNFEYIVNMENSFRNFEFIL